MGSVNINEILSKQEIGALTQRSDLRAGFLVLVDWAIVAGVFATCAYWTNPLTILLGVIVLGGRQLAFGALVHECGHHSLFKTRWLNTFCGHWLMGYPIMNNMETYMQGHLGHHREAGTPDDPDLTNYQDYPITHSRLRRKLWRDVTGQTGWKRIKSIGRAIKHRKQLPPQIRTSLYRGLLANLFMLAVLTALGYGWLYLMWPAAFMTSHMIIVRIRQVAEHAAVPDLYDLDPRMNTRTTYVNWLERLLFSPHGLNYHLEHHFLASVPIYHLREMHNLLKTKGLYQDVHFPTGYLPMLREVTVPG